MGNFDDQLRGLSASAITGADPAAVAADQARLLRLGLQLPLFDL